MKVFNYPVKNRSQSYPDTIEKIYGTEKIPEPAI